MNYESLIRSAYWLGRLKGSAEKDGLKEIAEMADMAADALADACTGCTTVRPAERKEEEEYYE